MCNDGKFLKQKMFQMIIIVQKTNSLNKVSEIQLSREDMEVFT